MLKPQLLQNQMAESIYMAQSEPEVELPPKQEVVVCILKWGAVYQYTIPGFSVITVSLRHAEIQAQQDNEILLLDVFFRNESLPDTNLLPLPLTATIVEACLVEVSGYYNYE